MTYLAIISATQAGRVAKFAEFDTQAEAEAHVVRYGGFVAETPDAPWSHWLIDMDERTVGVDVPEPPPEPRRIVPRRVIVDRLHAAGLLDAAKQALASDSYKQERWYALETGPFADDADTIALLTAIGADPDAILAPEDTDDQSVTAARTR